MKNVELRKHPVSKSNIQLVIAGFLSGVCTFAYCGEADGIYHDGWIDFNKNGKKDVYED